MTDNTNSQGHTQSLRALLADNTGGVSALPEDELLDRLAARLLTRMKAIDGRVSVSQAGRHGFEFRHPLQLIFTLSIT